LDIILDNIWRDANKIRSQKDAVSFGKTLVIGAAGFLATVGLFGLGGLLAGLGFSFGDKLLDFKNSLISEKIVQLLNKDYLYNIYDFQQRHNIGTK
jgi:hypothetical protein